ncbi:MULTISPECIES: tRNA preQ1(34) S-adenosylmethionine ribosyltransferase-isomerase QueA [unclassified Pusillimonas]|uniref:tRNA preQ1(34) S-adenosylmethionine ribosyltransferase-isomerase QueA n=1 Tax=unclassified Pusillimonas TaxID=2640016 RepID=UPI000B9D3205|nr:MULTISPECIES: tRNA preQ1(34) S-adenosylmethionine ribosyltransferase-isomerase QueA [unclassified Pusillimonas]OXR50623.1 tRNA preQ1(34) S-adenosylmethionine ribosyltransferase-isomerase QueA [Pusillimonas sp. T2]ROT45454.1 tRNA preQ1(34) S-adenosylmethionine ribosyltransferase-isomerase QueA [Pusillimonas sp. NJUB218]
MTHDLDLAAFDYELPPELIAQKPAAERTASRLLHLDKASQLHDRQFTDLPDLLRPNDLLVFNNTKVIKARLRGHKESGGKVELLIERITDINRGLAHIKASKSPKPGTRLRIADAFTMTVTGRQGELFEVEFPEDALTLLEHYGATPLPPYIEHAADNEDDERYQTVYAQQPGAVAAPTAGLHFDQPMLDQLASAGIGQCYVTLHVGAGTFQPVRVDKISEHVMHYERFSVDADVIARIRQARAKGGRVIAVGTTSVRALESAAALLASDRHNNSLTGDTNLFITPGYTFQLVDALITNFHLPRSTLMMLVSALAGIEPIRQAYAHAVTQRYRFFSYGDAMLIESPHS